MPYSVVMDDLDEWRECRDCGLFQRLPALADGEAATCGRCDALLRRTFKNSLSFARINAVAAAFLLALALALPLVDLRVLGRFCSSTLLSGPERLKEDGFAALGVVVLMTLVVLPAAKLAVEIVVLFGARAHQPQRSLAWLFAGLDRLSPWAMIEIFLLGSFIAYSRLKALAHVHVGVSALALAGAMLCMVAIDATLDREAVWRALCPKIPAEPRLRQPLALGNRSAAAEDSVARARATTTPIIGCDACGYVARATEGEMCSRCRHPLSVRKRTLHRTWALVLTAALLYVPSNVLPVMTIKRMGKGGPTTIVHGVVELAQSHLWPLALLVLAASVIIPVVKLLSLSAMLVLTHRRSARWLHGRTRLFRAVKIIGRWSMIDIFALAVLVGVVRLGAIASVLPGLGAAAFCSIVVMTMAATETFDPRLMWDAAERQNVVFVQEAVSHGQR
ncbi:MAG: PqiA/YebS family transporter subunit [Polyangiaceae bacterium]|jgi:paraquat-inducible protein A